MTKKLSKDNFVYILLTLLVLLLSGCNDDDDGIPVGDKDFVATDDPDNFLQFPNPQNSLGAGTGYKLVVGTSTAGVSGSFSGTIELSDGTSIACSGSWDSSAGPSNDSTLNPFCQFDVTTSGGAAISISSSEDICLYLVDRNDGVVKGSNGQCEFTATMELPESLINFDDHGAAYYRVIDPENTRTTLQDWITQNRFGQPCTNETMAKFGQCETHVQFRDTKDLGYGRNMYVRREDNTSGLTHFAVYVENFQVDAIPGLQYSGLNYQALVNNDRQWHFGSNAIEFSTYPYGAGEPSDAGSTTLYTKFFTFLADKTDFSAPETRLNSVNLDSRGFRSMPGPCISCHGGKSRPLLPDGSLSPPYPGGHKGDTQAKMQAIEVNTVGFPNPGDPRPPGQEAGLKFVNQAIRDTYKVLCNQNDAIDGACENGADTNGEWNPTQPLEWLAGSYGGVDNQDRYIADEYDSSYVPSGWRPNLVTGSPPAGADTLFLEVVKPHCLVCHNKRGNDHQNDPSNPQNRSNGSISFKSYADFISHAPQIERYVYEKGLMPLGILNFDLFWDNTSPNKPALLASFLPEFSRGNPDGTAIEPGQPIAYIAAPQVTRVPVTISAAGSAFSDQFRWQLIDFPAGANAQLSSLNQERTELTTDLDGDYTIGLTTSKTEKDGTIVSSEPVTFVMTVNDAVTLDGVTQRPRPKDITFSDIRNVLQNNPLAGGGVACAVCHQDPSTAVLTRRFEQIPIYYTDAQAEGRDLYKEVVQRVNFSDPLESWLLRRPVGNQHPGGCLGGFDIYPGEEPSSIPDCDGTDGDRRNYDLFLTWILEGAIQ